uniref:heat shock 70 kDa protein 14 isoform X2 n=1 Tax=Myxine glutinosa TaxID=7769 RepID=UPI00358EF0D2
MAAVGVHFGASSACVAVCKDGHVDVVANDAGDRVTPAVVAFCDGETLVGLAAKQGRIRNANSTVVGVKRILGRRFSDDEVQQYIKRNESTWVVENDGWLVFKISEVRGARTITPQQVVVLVLAKMRDTAQAAAGSDTRNVVLAAPIGFSAAQLAALRAAAEEADLSVLRIISEPAAALLAHGVGQNNPQTTRIALVYKFGGTGVEVTAVKVVGGMYRMLGATADGAVGGESFSEMLAQHMAAEFERARFESLCGHLFQQALQPVQDLMAQLGLCPDDIQMVVLCGGASRVPRLRSLICEMFPGAEIPGGFPPDEVVAMGAAVQAGLLLAAAGKAWAGGAQAETNELGFKVECSAQDIFVKVVNGNDDEMQLVLPSGTPLPIRRQHTFCASGSVPAIYLRVLEGEANIPLAQVVLKDLPPIEAMRDLVSIFTMKRDGNLVVSFMDQQSGKTESVTIEACRSEE